MVFRYGPGFLMVLMGFSVPGMATGVICDRPGEANEPVICSQPLLRELESVESFLFRLYRKELAPGARAQLDTEEALWNDARHTCNDDVICQFYEYDIRITRLEKLELAGAVPAGHIVR